MPDLSKYIEPDFDSSQLHSSGLGRGGGNLTMNQRQQLLHKDRDIRVVGEYERSRLGSQGSTFRARSVSNPTSTAYDPSKETSVDDARYGSNRQRGGLNEGRAGASIERRQHFVEPLGRKYNPFA